MAEREPGMLYLVGTPIGNLGDITLRALDTLRAVSCVVAEDTRRTHALLAHFQIEKKELVACHAHSSDAVIARLVERLVAGESVAFVTDAGMPGVSDPGAALVRAASERGVRAVPIPGASAVTAAVAVSALIDGPFTFLGFLPRQGRKRGEALERIAKSAEPTVLFEAPGRIERTLAELAALVPERRAVLCRELTKLHEDVRRGALRELAQGGEWRGEATLVVAAADAAEAGDASDVPDDLDAVIAHELAQGESPRGVVEKLALRYAVPRRELYRRVTRVAEKRGRDD